MRHSRGGAARLLADQAGNRIRFFAAGSQSHLKKVTALLAPRLRPPIADSLGVENARLGAPIPIVGARQDGRKKTYV